MATRPPEPKQQTRNEPGPREGPAWTVRRLLQWTADYFQRNGLPAARLDAEVLLAHVLEKDRLGLYLDYDAVVEDGFLKCYRQLILRRVASEPVAYLTGMREFYSASFCVGPAVMIPRPETEHLVEHALLHLKKEFPARDPDSLRILDIGTGCGNLPVILSRNLEGAWIVSVDICAGALTLARRNRGLRSHAGARVFFVQGDLVEWLRPGRPLFHVIVSNPPYVSEQEWQGLQPEVRDHEPRLAICGGPAGTELQERILESAGRFLHENGALVMEIGESQSAAVRELADRSGLYADAGVFPDYAGRPRVLVARKKQTAQP